MWVPEQVDDTELVLVQNCNNLVQEHRDHELIKALIIRWAFSGTGGWSRTCLFLLL